MEDVPPEPLPFLAGLSPAAAPVSLSTSLLEEVTWQAMMGKATQGGVHEKDAWKHKTPRCGETSVFPPALKSHVVKP